MKARAEAAISQFSDLRAACFWEKASERPAMVILCAYATDLARFGALAASALAR